MAHNPLDSFILRRKLERWIVWKPGVLHQAPGLLVSVGVRRSHLHAVSVTLLGKVHSGGRNPESLLWRSAVVFLYSIHLNARILQRAAQLGPVMTVRGTHLPPLKANLI